MTDLGWGDIINLANAIGTAIVGGFVWVYKSIRGAFKRQDGRMFAMERNLEKERDQRTEEIAHVRLHHITRSEYERGILRIEDKMDKMLDKVYDIAKMPPK